MPDLDYFILGHGPVILFLHGWGQNKEMLISLANKLKKNYTCVVVDMPGFGNSKYNEEMNLDEYCERIYQFLLIRLHLNPVYIIGHSFGGKVAIHYYLKYKNLKGLILIASPILKPKRTLLYYIKVWIYKFKKKFNINNNMGSEDYKNSKELKRFFVHVVNTHYDKKITNINIPVLMFYSKGDRKVEFSKAKKLARKLKKGRLRVIKGDHFAYLNNENIISIEINNFIKENEVKREYYL